MTRGTPRPEAGALRRMYVEEHETIAAIGARLGVANQTVHNWLIAAGVPRRPSPATTRTDVADEEVRRLFVEEHWTAAEIAAHLGCGATTVDSRLVRSGAPRRPPVPRRSRRPGDHELGRLYQDQGLSLRAMASWYGVSAQAVRGWLVAAGIARRVAGGQAAPLDDDVVAARYLQGRSGAELAREFGCSPATVYRRLEAVGVPRRPPTVAIDRAALLDGLAAGSSAPAMAAAAGVSVSAVCRALAREHLHTASQLARLDAAEHRRSLSTRAGHSGTSTPAAP